MKKMSVAVIAVLAFVAGYLAPKQNSNLVKDQGYKAGDYTIFWRSYRGKGGKAYQKIDIQGKYNLKGGIYKKGATIDENKQKKIFKKQLTSLEDLLQYRYKVKKKEMR